MAGDGNGDGGDEAARPRPGGSSRRKKQMRRSSWTARRGEVVAVAAGTAIGVGELARWRSVFAGERARGESEREERAVGAAWHREGGPRRRGGSGRKPEVAGARGRARRPHVSRPTGERWKMTGSNAGLGRPGGLPGGLR